MSVLVACECSQVVTSAFLDIGIDAYSCDLQPCYGAFPERHIQRDALEVLYSRSWDLVIAHPPCTYLSQVGYSNFFCDGVIRADRLELAIKARDFFLSFYNYSGRICIENPVHHNLVELPPYSQIIQPYDYGEIYSKRTCLWLKGLPGLISTLQCPKEFIKPWVYGGADSDDLSLGHNRQWRRSRFFPGVAAAMASQWRGYCSEY